MKTVITQQVTKIQHSVTFLALQPSLFSQGFKFMIGVKKTLKMRVAYCKTCLYTFYPAHIVCFISISAVDLQSTVIVISKVASQCQCSIVMFRSTVSLASGRTSQRKLSTSYIKAKTAASGIHYHTCLFLNFC
jgi:hypothetical protein